MSELTELALLDSYFAIGFLEGLFCGYANLEPLEGEAAVIEPSLFMPALARVSEQQRQSLIDVARSINGDFVNELIANSSSKAQFVDFLRTRAA